MSSALAKINPFPGLRPFTQEEDYLFFGREEQTLELLQRLASNRFVAVVGSSGSGKSSLVRCGLLSELLGGRMLGAGSAWEIAVTHPGGNPLALLTDSLLEADLYDRQEEHARENLLATLSRSHFGLVEAVKQADLGEDTNFLLVVDQFEEIFRFQDAGQRQQEVANEFISLLLEAVAQKEVPIYVVLTMRSDFIGECGQFEGLAEMVNRGEFLIPRLTREQYKRVIEGPIKVAGGQITPRLLQRLLNDLGQQADQLPCLQHALMRTWEVGADSGDPQGLDLDDYQQIGRMAEALSLHADEIYATLGSDRQRELCRALFQALTVEESNNRGIRRPQRLGRLCQILEVPAEELLPIIEAYRQSGVTFLMPSPDVELVESTIIDISHESLMRVWTRLRQWVEEESQAAGIYHRLSESAALQELGKAGLYRDPELGIALAWQEGKHPNAAWAERYRPGFAAAMAFLEASQLASAAKNQAREAARHRELAQAQQLAEAEGQRATDQTRAAARLRWLVRGLGLVAMVAIMATAFAWVASQEARRNADVAVQAQQDTEKALKEAEAAETLARINEAEAVRQKAAALFAEQRSREFLYSTDVQLAATLVADPTANASQILARLSDHDPKSNFELKGKEDLRGFEWHYLKRMVEERAMVFEGFKKQVVAVAMSPAGELVTLDSDSRLQHFNPATRQETQPALDLGKGRSVSSAALSGDGRQAALAIGDKVHLVDVATGEEAPRPIPAGTRNGLLFSPDGNMLITVDTGLGWWDAATGNPIAVDDFELAAGQPGYAPVSVSGDGLTVAVGGQGQNRSSFSTFRMDRPARGITRLLDKVGGGGSKRALAISPDGQTVAVSLYFAGSIVLYDATTGKLLLDNTSAHPASVTAISFSPDSTQLVTAAMDGSVKVWKDYKQLDTADATSLVGHAQQIDTLSWVAAGKQVVSAGTDKSVRLWNLEQDADSLHRTIADTPSARATYSPDGTLLAISGETGTIQLRDGQTVEVVAILPREDSDLESSSVAFSPDSRLLAVGFGGKQDVSLIELWDIDRRERLAVMPGSTDIPEFVTDQYSGVVSGLAFSPDGKHLVASFGSPLMIMKLSVGNYPLVVYDVAARRMVRRLEGPGNTSASVAFSPDGTRLASACYDGTARIWDTVTWQQSHVLDNPDKGSASGNRRVGDVAFSPDGKRLAMASAEGNVILWEVQTGTHIETLRGHANEVGSVTFSPDGRTLASGSMDGTIRLWNTATWRELVRLAPGGRFYPRSLSFSPGGDRLLAADIFGRVLEWSIRPADNVSGSMGESLAKVWRSGVDLKNRVRMQSEQLRLHETLSRLASEMPADQTAAAAAAATAANWHASVQQWAAAVEQFDRLKQLDSESPAAWLRTPGLLRLATALFHQHRPADAASLLAGGDKSRAQDGNGQRSVGLIEALLALVDQKRAESPSDAGLLELRAELVGLSSDYEQQVIDYTAAIEALAGRGEEGAATDLVRLHGRRGNAYVGLERWQLAQDDFAKAINTETSDEALLTNQALALGNILLGLPQWTVLKPVEARSERGASLTLQPDGSILASGANVDGDVYTLTTAAHLGRIAAIRLEVLPDPSLPGGGPGRHPSGNFHLRKFDLFQLAKESGERVTPLPIGRVWASFAYQAGNADIAGTIEKNSTKFWHVWGRTGQAHEAVFQLVDPVDDSDQSLVIQLSQFHPLGRFRLAFSDSPEAISRQDRYLAAPTFTDPWTRLAEAYRRDGNPQALADLVRRRPEQAGPIGDLFIRDINNEAGSVKDWQGAVEIYSLGITPDKTDAQLLSRRARAYEQLQDWKAAAADWTGAADPTPAGAKVLIESAGRLSSSGQSELAGLQRERARQILETLLQADPGDAPAIDSLALLLLDISESLDRGWTSLRPPEHKTAGDSAVALQADGSLLVTGAVSDTLPLPELPTSVKAIRIETASAAGTDESAVPAFKDYRIEAVDAPRSPSGGFLGRYVRLDLPGDNRQFPRHEGDKDLKYINLAELQVFRGDENIAIGKNASADGGSGRLAPAGAVDGNTVGNDDGNPYAHSADNEAPWWEVDLGSEQAIDRMVVWNRSDVHLYGRMNHFRVSILDASRTVIFEQVIDEAPKPSREISCKRLLLAIKPAADAGPPQWSLRLGDEAGVAVGRRFRVSSTEELVSMKDEKAIAEPRKIAQPLARLAAAYDFNGAPRLSANWFRRALNEVKKSSERKLVLTLLQDHPQPLAELLKQQPDDIDLQLALARRHAKLGQMQLSSEKPEVALTEFQAASELFTQLRTQHPAPAWTTLESSQLTSQAGATLTRHPDGSLLVSGALQTKDTFLFDVSNLPAGATAIRLEALADARLPNGGPGTHRTGNFVLSEFRLLAGSQDGFASATPIPLETVFASVEERPAQESLSSGESGWSISADFRRSGNQITIILPEDRGQDQTAVFRISQPGTFESDAQRIVLDFQHTPVDQVPALLGRFRLSATNEPIHAQSLRLLDLKSAELATLDVAIGISLARQDRSTEAAAAFVRALERGDDEGEQKKLIEQMQDHTEALVIVAQQRPEDLPIQLALAKRLAQRGKNAVAENRQDQALPELARARELFAKLAAEHPETQWTVLQPTEMTSAGGTELTLQADHSIIASGANPELETYTIRAELDLPQIAAIRLETLPDSRFPKGGSGRDLNGSFNLNDLTVTVGQAGDQSNATMNQLVVSQAVASYQRPENPIEHAIDATPNSFWQAWPQTSVPQQAVIQFVPQTGVPTSSSIVVRLTSKNGSLGRFRLAVSDDPDARNVAQFRQELAASGLAELEISLGNAHARSGRQEEAATAFSQALNLATNRDAKATILAAASAYDGVLDKLTQLRADDAGYLHTLARYHQTSGDFAAAPAASASARAFYEQQLAADPSNSKVAGDLADLLFESHPVQWNHLKPEEIKSAGGADLKLLDDDSILASGINSDRDVYTIVARPELLHITGFRLEALPDDSLPLKGPGRVPDFGNFHLNELSVWSEGSPVRLADITTLYDETGLASQMIDGKVDDAMGWSNYPRSGQANAAFIATDLQRDAGSTLKFELHFSKAQWTQHNLGRFRLSVTDAPSPLGYEKKLLATKTILSPWSRLGAAYHGVGESDRAFDMFARSIETASTPAARTAAAQQAGALEDMFPRLQERFPSDPSLRLGQAKFIAAQHIDKNEFQLAVEILSPALAEFPNDLEMLNQRAGAWMKLANWHSAAEDSSRIIDLETDDVRRRTAQRTRAEALVRMGQFEAGTEAELQVMMRSPEWDGMRDAYSAALLAGNPVVARMVANRFFRTVSGKQDLDAYWSGELVRLHTAIPGLVTQDNQQRLLEAAARTGGDWTTAYSAAIHFRLGDLEKAQALLDTPMRDREFQALAAMLLCDQGELKRAAGFLEQAERWLQQESAREPQSAIPSQVWWDIWAVSRTVWHEAARKLIGPRITELDELLAKEPDRSVELLERAEVLAQVGLFEEALNDLQRLGTLNVHSPELLALHGRILAGLGRDQEALPLLNRAIEGGSPDSAVFAARGTVLLRQGQTDAAREDLEKSLSLKPNVLAAGALADLLLTGAASATRGTVLEPTEAISEGGATLSVLDNHSIPASGTNPLGDAYRIEFEKKRLAAMQATNSWARLLLAYQLHGRDAESAALAQTHPEISRVIADAQFGNADWEGAIAGYSKLIDNETTDASLLVKRGEAYFAAKQSDRARADWRRAAKLIPELAQTQFDRLRLVSRWGEAAEFGLLLIEQKPEDTMLWVRVAPLAVLSDDDALYEQLCRRVLELYREAPTVEAVDRAIKVCLLKPGIIDISELPLDTFSTSLDSTAPEWFPAWFWGTRAIAAYRSGHADLAVQYVAQSEQHKPSDHAHAMNLGTLAMAQHELQHFDEARMAIEEAALLLKRLQAGDRNHHDVVTADILFREAEAKINRTTERRPPDDTTTP